MKFGFLETTLAGRERQLDLIMRCGDDAKTTQTQHAAYSCILNVGLNMYPPRGSFVNFSSRKDAYLVQRQSQQSAKE